MYEIRFVNAPKNWALPFKTADSVIVSDLERALAVASLLQKVSTPEVPFGDIEVLSLNKQENEK